MNTTQHSLDLSPLNGRPKLRIVEIDRLIRAKINDVPIPVEGIAEA